MIRPNDIATGLQQMTSTAEAAEILNVTPIRVRQLIAEGRLKAHRFNGQYVLNRAEVEQFAKIPRPVGNPNLKKRHR